MTESPDHSPDLDRDRPAPAVRITDHERAQVERLLQLALADGSLDLAELDRRLAAAYAARSHDELAAVTADLPVAAAREPLVLNTVSGSLRKDGRWVVPAEITVAAVSGSVRLDFTEAICPHTVVQLHLGIASGNVRLTVPRGWQVDLDGVAFVSGSPRNRVTEPPLPGCPTLRVDGSVTSGSVRAEYAKPPRRSFWAWLRRRPRR
ncbi:DUF1707 SHOCT-like domain-containing protein [Nocardia veterana]|uniref:DUF1707 domain-containing protein n=1 Tax=Nocardia veterana TaxID=132249 RepID=A0A7X6RHA5_9NOCA|nr:DUF1707 domain-containing protein [Nocardia veterana]NKY85403.1 DUF1707 domain-containing protein [Nocardia veterana]